MPACKWGTFEQSTTSSDKFSVIKESKLGLDFSAWTWEWSYSHLTKICSVQWVNLLAFHWDMCDEPMIWRVDEVVPVWDFVSISGELKQTVAKWFGLPHFCPYEARQNHTCDDAWLLDSSRHLVIFPIEVLSQQFDLLHAELVGLWMMPSLVPQLLPCRETGRSLGLRLVDSIIN